MSPMLIMIVICAAQRSFLGGPMYLLKCYSKLLSLTFISDRPSQGSDVTAPTAGKVSSAGTSYSMPFLVYRISASSEIAKSCADGASPLFSMPLEATIFLQCTSHSYVILPCWFGKACSQTKTRNRLTLYNDGESCCTLLKF